MSAPESSQPPDRDPDSSPGPGSQRWSAALARLGGLVVLAVCAVSAVVGAIAAPPGAAFTFTVLALAVIGPLVGLLRHQGGADRWSSSAAGALAAGAAVLLFLVVGGLIAVFGAAV